MTVFLKFQSTRDLYECKTFGIKSTEFYFLLTGPIDVLEWPYAFSDYIVREIKDSSPHTCFIGILLSNSNKKGNIPFMPITRLTPDLFSIYFEQIFNNVDSISDTLKLKVTVVSPPSY